MKIFGRTYDRPHVETLVLPREEGDIVFKAQSVLNYKEFDAICPVPEAKKILTPGGTTKVLTNEPAYLDALNHWANHKMQWMILKSLQATPGLEWDRVDFNNPSTWAFYTEELEAAFFSETEVTLITNLAINVNSLNETKLEEARKRFLAQEAVQ
jgi:hypothetical protein